MNHQTADPKVNASVFLFFSTAHFLKIILALRTNGTFGFARHTSRPFAKPKEPFFADSFKKITNIASKFKDMRQTILFLGFLIALSSCNNVQSRLDKAEKGIEYAEQNKEEMTAKDWSVLERKMQELESDLEQNRDKYTDEQVKEIGKLQGRYFAVAVKKGINDFQESVKDLGNQMEGFIEGITDSTNNKNK
jgi:chromosome segregation ATPase